MPRFRRNPNIIITLVRSSFSALVQRLQRYLVASAIINTRTPTTGSGNRNALLDFAAEHTRIVLAPRHSSRAGVPARGEDFAEEWTENCAAGGCDCEAGFAARPDCDVGCGVEEVLLVAEGVDVGDSDDCGYGGSVDGQYCYPRGQCCREDSHST
jgi:hypothetical protein